MMKYLINCLLLIFASGIMKAQSFTPDVVASAGENFSGNGISLEWTLGELAIESFAGTIVLTQGFHQPTVNTTPIEDKLGDLGTIKVYPNPTSGLIAIEREKRGDVQMRVSDMQGRIVLQENESSKLTYLDLSHLPSGVYVLNISDKKNAFKSIRIQKR